MTSGYLVIGYRLSRLGYWVIGLSVGYPPSGDRAILIGSSGDRAILIGSSGDRAILIGSLGYWAVGVALRLRPRDHA
jgi:hypothetical protein